ncbi:MAG: hypothetical protein KGQ66_03250 [Acidobacteriota bacterium]|nr:hypothetical protein [Acidobacteriota bacterium]
MGKWVAAALSGLLAALLPALPADAAGPSWTVSWAAAMAANLDQQYAVNATVRQVAPLSIGGDQVRAQISNKYGNAPLVVAAATLALAGSGPATVAGTMHPLSFGGAPSVTVPIGGSVYSDAVSMTVQGGQSVAVSLFVSTRDSITEHYDAGSGVSYASLEGAGDLTAEASGAGLAYPQTWDRFVSGVDVAGGPTPPAATVVFGDSISDGYNFNCPGLQSYCTLTTAWPTVMTQRLLSLPDTQRVGIANESITANAVTPQPDDDSKRGGGEPGVTRMVSDVFAQPGINRVFLLLGTNDLWFGATPDQVIAGYQQVLARAKAAGIPVIASTLLPRATGAHEVWTPAMEANRLVVNKWILHSGAFAAVVDLAAVIGNVYNGACSPDVMFPAYDSGDHLHPNTAGEVAMADAVPTTLLGAGAAPAAAPLVSAVPTPGCVHDPLVTINSPVLAAAGSTTTTPSTSTASPTAPATTAPPGATKTVASGATRSSSSTPTGLIVGVGVGIVAVAALAVARFRRASRRRGRHHFRRR